MSSEAFFASRARVSLDVEELGVAVAVARVPPGKAECRQAGRLDTTTATGLSAGTRTGCGSGRDGWNAPELGEDPVLHRAQLGRLAVGSQHGASELRAFDAESESADQVLSVDAVRPDLSLLRSELAPPQSFEQRR